MSLKDRSLEDTSLQDPNWLTTAVKDFVFSERPNAHLRIAVHTTFGCLSVLLLLLLIATYNIHVLALFCIANAFWASVAWFLIELDSFQSGKKSQ